MESIEDGPFYWTYSQSLWSNPTILYTVLKVMMIAVFIILLLIGGLSVIEGDFDPVFLLYLTVGLTIGASVRTFVPWLRSLCRNQRRKIQYAVHHGR